MGKGNNNKLIKSLIKRRFWIELVGEETKGINFYWTQSKLRNVHAQQLEFREEEGVSKSVINKYKQSKVVKNEENLKILSSNESRVIEGYLNLHSPHKSIFPKASPNIVTNHIPQNSLIGNKKALFHSLSYYYKYITN